MNALFSPLFTLVLFALSFILVGWGCIAQAYMSNQKAIETVFYCFFVTYHSVPIFLGGFSLAFLWTLNFLGLFYQRVPFKKRYWGIWILHLSLLGLLGTQACEIYFKKEGQVSLTQGQGVNFATSVNEYELIFSDASHSEYDEIHSLQLKDLREGKSYTLSPLNLKIKVLNKLEDSIAFFSPPTQGRYFSSSKEAEWPYFFQEKIPSSQVPTPALILELSTLNPPKILGHYTFHASLPQPSSLLAHKLPYLVMLQKKKTFFPFTLHLQHFKKELYPGSNVPKSFTSLIEVYSENSQLERLSLLYMNHPLTLGKHTFYQASYSQDEKTSILQWVHYPYSWTPYSLAIFMALGLALHLLRNTLPFLKKTER